MSGNTLLHPVGPLPPGVYWRRRLVAFAILAVVILVVAVACSGSGSSPRRPAAVVHSPTPTATATATAAAACARADLTVSASTDATSYAAGVLPRLTMVVRNAGAAACTLTDGPSLRTWTVISGSDRVWTTNGCVASKTVRTRVLAPQATVRHTIVWNRHRSGNDCAASDTEAGPGTYQLTASFDGTRSGVVVFHLKG